MRRRGELNVVLLFRTVVKYSPKYKAMSTGDPSAVTFMYRVLRKGMIDNPSDDTILREQLFKEYGVDVDDEEIGLLEGAPKMEEDEMKAVVDFLDTCAST